MVHSEVGGEGISAVVGKGGSRFGVGKEEGSGGIRRMVGNRQGGGNAHRNDDGPGMRAGIQIRNFI